MRVFSDLQLLLSSPIAIHPTQISSLSFTLIGDWKYLKIGATAEEIDQKKRWKNNSDSFNSVPSATGCCVKLYVNHQRGSGLAHWLELPKYGWPSGFLVFHIPNAQVSESILDWRRVNWVLKSSENFYWPTSSAPPSSAVKIRVESNCEYICLWTVSLLSIWPLVIVIIIHGQISWSLSVLWPNYTLYPLPFFYAGILIATLLRIY